MGPGGTPYVVRGDLSQYLPVAVLKLATEAQQDQACLDATEEADSYIRGRFQLPLLAWGNDLRRYTAYVAIYLLMSGPIGWAATNGSPDENIRTNYYRAVGWPDRQGTGWFPGIQRQAIQPDVTPSTPVGADPVHDAPQVSSQAPRGWQQMRRGKPVVGGF
jgi:phage gp36-like protein